MVGDRKLAELEATARELRYHIIRMMGANRTHHFGGSLSVVELVTALYFYKMRYDPSNPRWDGRDRFIMSKGHTVPTQYVALAKLGVLPMEDLPTLKRLGSILQGHPNACMTPGLEACTGSLGQGLSFANGVAMAARIRGLDIRVYCLMGDGELQEGQVWEAAMGSTTHKLDNLCAMVDRNGLKSQGVVDDAKLLEPLAQKWEAFGWHAITVDGHHLRQICDALDEAETVKGKPTVIIAKTVKGKGVPFMEGQFQFHNAPITKEQWEEAMRVLALDEEEV
ncbi:MAG: transketolase [Chloroflexi bacterium]|nr:transketolase [Chloroflexota bacterium]